MKIQKRILAIFLSMLMVFTVFAPTMVVNAKSDVAYLPESEALAWPSTSNWQGATWRGTTFGTGGKYGMSLWQPTWGDYSDDGDVTNDVVGYMEWSWYNDQNTRCWVRVEYPRHIYLDKTESLESVGYRLRVTGSYGGSGDGTDCKIAVNGSVWGNFTDNRGGRTESTAMTDWFTGYSHVGTISNATVRGNNFLADEGQRGPLITENNADAEKNVDFMNNYTYDDHNTLSVFWRRVYNLNEYILLMGAPNKTGEANFTTSGWGGDFCKFYWWNSGKWNLQYSGTEDNKGSSSSYRDGNWKEIRMDFVIYDKADLNTAIYGAEGGTAATAASNSAYKIYETGNADGRYTASSWSAFESAYNAAYATLTTREVTQTDINTAKTNLNNALNSLKTRIILNGTYNGGTVDSWVEMPCGANPTVEFLAGNGSEVKTSKPGWDFAGWTTNIDAQKGQTGGGFNVYIGRTVYATFSKDVTANFHYMDSQGEPATYSGTTTIYNKATGGDVDVYNAGPVTKDTKQYTFKGWTADPDSYTVDSNIGDKLTVDAATGLKDVYAVYESPVTLTYDANSGENAPADQTENAAYNYNLDETGGVAFTVSDAQPTKDGYDFLGWATTASATEPDVEQSITATEDTTVYAVWQIKTYDITFNFNYDGAPTQVTVAKTHGVDLAFEEMPTPADRDDYIFLGWAESAEAEEPTYTAGTFYTDDESSTLYAIWKQDAFTVQFFDRENNPIGDVQYVKPGDAAVAPDVPEYVQNDDNSHFRFIGWDRDFDNVTESLEIHAQYESEEHNLTEGREVTAANCIYDAVWEYKCVCGLTEQETKPDTATGIHTEGTKATCSSKAVCSVCHEEYGDYDTDNHKGGFRYDVVKAATCGESGTQKKICVACGEIAGTETIPATGAHTGGSATCSKLAECEVCGQKYGDYNYDIHTGNREWRISVAATCITDGTEILVCTDCGKTVDTRTIPASENHTGGAATCRTRAICNVCHQYYGDLNPSNHENIKVIPEQPATCDKDGYTPSVECVACGSTVTESSVIPALGHTDSDGDDYCDVCDQIMPDDDDDSGNSDGNKSDLDSFRCKWCVIYEVHKDSIEGPIYGLIHLLLHSIYYIIHVLRFG